MGQLHEEKEALSAKTRNPLGAHIDAASLRQNKYVKYDAKGDVIPFYRYVPYSDGPGYASRSLQHRPHLTANLKLT